LSKVLGLKENMLEWDEMSIGLLSNFVNNYAQFVIGGLDLLKKLNLDAESLKIELKGLIPELGDESLLSLAVYSHCSELYQRYCPSEHLTYMLYALINGNEKLAKAHALYEAASIAKKLPTQKLPKTLFLEVYKECCDLKNESFRLALARLLFYHI